MSHGETVSEGRPLAQGSAPGKLILFGEHAVVYGHPAVAAAVNLRSTVTLWPSPGSTHIRRSSFDDDRLRRAVSVALPPRGLAVDIGSQLPPGRGMGSSASIAVALVRAAARLAGEQPGLDTLFERSLVLERIFHGHPSGVDNMVALRGGLLRFRRGPPLEIEPLALPRPLRLVVLDSGSPGDTAALVASVRSARPGVDPALEAMGALCVRACDQLDDPVALGRTMDQAQALLVTVGVSTPRLGELCALARSAGALGAKLSGAGGGGVVIALAEPDTTPSIMAAARAQGVPAFSIDLPTPSIEPVSP